MKPFFAKQNIVRENRANALLSLFVVRCQFLLNIFATGSTFAFVEETATSTQILGTAYNEKPVRKTWQTPVIHYSLYIRISAVDLNRLID